MKLSLTASNETSARTRSRYWARQLGACAAAGLGIAAVVIGSTPARAQVAENAACGAATAAAITAKWAAEQQFARREALATIAMNERTAAAAAEADAGGLILRALALPPILRGKPPIAPVVPPMPRSFRLAWKSAGDGNGVLLAHHHA